MRVVYGTKDDLRMFEVWVCCCWLGKFVEVFTPLFLLV